MMKNDRKNKRRSRFGHLFTRVVCGTLTAAMLFPMAVRADDHEGVLVDDAEHTDLMFEDYEYYRMELSDFEQIVDGLEDLVLDEANADRVLEIIIAMEDYYNEMDRNYSIMNLYASIDCTDEGYKEEVKFYDVLSTEVGDRISQAYKTIAVSPCSDVLHERIDDEDEWQDILDYTELTEEQKDLSARETELSLSYDEMSIAEYTTEINGTKYTMDDLPTAFENGVIDQMSYLRGIGDITTQRNEALGNLYLELVDVRTQLARSYGYDNYADYAYDRIYDRDYTPEDLEEYRQSIRDYYVDLSAELYDQLFDVHYDSYKEMWEVELSVDESLKRLRDHIGDISPDLYVSYDYMVDHHLYDLSVSDVKAPGGFTTSIPGYNAPFLYNCASGDFSDMGTLIHEFGHYNEMYYMSADSWYYDVADIDIAEIHSQGLEMLFYDFYEDIYGEYADIMKIYNCFNLVYSAIEGVKEDAFQYEVYRNADGITLDDINQMYYEYCKEYGDQEYYNSFYLGTYGLTAQNSILEWVDIPHTFQSPMYYISYSVSVSAVEELRDRTLDDRDDGISVYLDLVEEEFQSGFQDTLINAGLNNPIANPRFDVYANNIRYTLGLSDERMQGTETVEEPETTEKPQEEIQEDKPGSDEETTSSHHRRSDDDDDDDKDRSTREQEEKTVRTVLIIGIVIASILVIGLIIAIIAIIKSSGKDKQAQNNNGQPLQKPYDPTGENLYGGGVEPVRDAYGQPIQTQGAGYGQQPIQTQTPEQNNKGQDE